MKKYFNSLGLMSGTSGDGIDASIINSDGENVFNLITNKYRKYDEKLSEEIFSIQEEVNFAVKNTNNLQDIIKKHSKKIEKISIKITNFHIDLCKDLLKTFDVDVIGFHGQTILHKPQQLLSIQIGSGKILSKSTKKMVVYDFRKNDILNGGEGAPLTPIFHKLICNKKKLKLPVSILNIGGIANITNINQDESISSYDIGPGNCMLDNWIKLKSTNFTFDKNGLLSRAGKVDKFILNQALDNYFNSDLVNKKSYDINDFEIQFLRGLNLENGAATLVEFVSEILSKKIKNKNLYLCGGGRKNLHLIDTLQKKMDIKLKNIDEINIDGDFVESQAFAYLAIRSILGLPITFPETTGCLKPSTGGEIIEC